MIPYRNAVTFEIGDVVQLKSGGPNMVIFDLWPDEPVVECTWFDQTLNVRKWAFNMRLLVKVT